MNVAELIEVLESCDPASEVRLAEQPNWPLEYDARDLIEGQNGAVYLVEGEQRGYLPGVIAEEAWSQ